MRESPAVPIPEPAGPEHPAWLLTSPALPEKFPELDAFEGEPYRRVPGEYIYIAETSPIRQHPALVVYDVARRTSRRVLDGEASLSCVAARVMWCGGAKTRQPRHF